MDWVDLVTFYESDMIEMDGLKHDNSRCDYAEVNYMRQI